MSFKVRRPLLVLATASFWVALWPRTVPSPLVSDRGTFISVAERLVAGDRLYVDVWDNKDPLFYYANAVGRLFGPFADLALEAAWLAVAMVAVGVLARALGAAPVVRWALVCLATPAVLTGSFYFSGHTHLPGTAVGLAVLAATVRRRYLGAGVLLGLVAGLKLIAVPVVGVAALVFFLLRREPRGLLLGIAGAALSASGWLAVLAVRGELVAYADVLLSNARYAGADWLQSSSPSWLAHLERVWSTNVLACLIGVAAALMVGAQALRRPVPTREREPGERDAVALWWATAASLVAAIGVLMLTALWQHHAQLLYLPGTLALVVASARPGNLRRLGAVLSAIVFVGGAWAVSGGAGPRLYLGAAEQVPVTLGLLASPTPGAEAVLAGGSSGRIARVGTNDAGTFFGLRAWHLACPRFHQYPFDPPETFAAGVACLPSAEVIVVDAKAVPEPGEDAWNGYLKDVERLLSERYDCQPVDTGRVCWRRD